MKRGVVGVARTVVAATVLGGCSSSEPASIDEEQVYPDEVDELFMSMDENDGSRLTMTLGTLFPRFAPRDVQYSVIVNELREAKIDERVASDVATFEALQPPDRFQADHTHLLKGLNKQAGLTDEFLSALDKEDVLGLSLVRMKAFEISMRTSSQVSREMCGKITPEDGASQFCPPDGIVPGGEYGGRMREIVLNQLITFVPRGQIFLNFVHGDDYYHGLPMIQPQIEANFIETI